MILLPAALHSLAFLVSLFVQSWSSPLAGSWLFFYLAGCAVLLYQGNYPKAKSAVWYASVAWLLTIIMSAFLLAPVFNGATHMWMLVSFPALSLCLRKEHLKAYFIGFMAVATLYALGLIAQMYFGLHYTRADFTSSGKRGWPLVDPNNAAAVINLAFIPCMWGVVFKGWRWSILCVVFALALYATGSKAGMISAALMGLILMSARYGLDFLLFAIFMGLIFLGAILTYRIELVDNAILSFADRFPIWGIGREMLGFRPLLGLGLGSFGFYYSQMQTNYTYNWHSHNDLFNFAIEMGIPAALIFCWLVIAVALRSCKANLAATCTMLCIFLMSMVNFQFYMAAISIPMGLALAFHNLQPENKRYGNQ